MAKRSLLSRCPSYVLYEWLLVSTIKTIIRPFQKNFENLVHKVQNRQFICDHVFIYINILLMFITYHIYIIYIIYYTYTHIMAWWWSLWPKMIANNIINIVLCYTEYIYTVTLFYHWNPVLCSFRPRLVWTSRERLGPWQLTRPITNTRLRTVSSKVQSEGYGR